MCVAADRCSLLWGPGGAPPTQVYFLSTNSFIISVREKTIMIYEYESAHSKGKGIMRSMETTIDEK